MSQRTRHVSTQSVGRQGEDLACRFLERTGYTILERHVTSQYGEIDIVARDPKTEELVFVEVKTRRSRTFGTPAEAMTDSKLERLENTIATYLQRYPTVVPHRLDCIFITHDGANDRIEHVQSCG